MCFSAPVSFTTSAVLAGIGVLTLRQVRSKQEILLASFPLIFAFQQLMEGFLWLNIQAGRFSLLNNVFMFAFLMVAFVIWPIFFPLAAYLIEPNRIKQKWLFRFLCLGIFSSTLSLVYVIMPPVNLAERHFSIYYQVHLPPYHYFFVLCYVIATCTPMLISSYKILRIFGMVLILAFTIAAVFWYMNFTSVWCFFSAVLSLILYFHFRSKSLVSF